MYYIELKFYDRYWKNYFNKFFSKDDAYNLYHKLCKNFYSSHWRLCQVLMEYEPIDNKK